MSDREPPTIAESAIALVTAHLAEVPNVLFDEILADVNAGDLAVFLAAMGAQMVRDTDGGPAWLQRYGIAAAEGVA